MAGKTINIYLGDKLNSIVNQQSEELGISRGEYIRACVVNAIYADIFGSHELTGDSLQTIKAITDSGYNDEYIDFLRARNADASPKVQPVQTVQEQQESKPTPEELPKPEPKPKRVGKSKIPPASDIQFEGTTI